MSDSFLSSSSVAPGSTASSLIASVQQRDGTAWRRLVQVYGPLVHYWIRQSRVRSDDVADIFQESFLAVARHVNSFRKAPDRGSFRGWLRTIVRSKIVDWVRKHATGPEAKGGSDAYRELLELADSTPSGASGLAAATSDADLVRQVVDLVRSDFAERTWEAFWQQAVEGRSSTDVAEALGITANAARHAKARVLARLRRELGEISF